MVVTDGCQLLSMKNAWELMRPLGILDRKAGSHPHFRRFRFAIDLPAAFKWSMANDEQHNKGQESSKNRFTCTWRAVSGGNPAPVFNRISQVEFVETNLVEGLHYSNNEKHLKAHSAMFGSGPLLRAVFPGGSPWSPAPRPRKLAQRQR